MVPQPLFIRITTVFLHLDEDTDAAEVTAILTPFSMFLEGVVKEMRGKDGREERMEERKG